MESLSISSLAKMGGGASKVGPSPEVEGLKQQVASLQKTVSQLVTQAAPREFTVAQYNILAGYLGDNRQPWFLYGVDIPPARRAEIMTKFYQRGEDGKYVNAGWPKCKLPPRNPLRRTRLEPRCASFTPPTKAPPTLCLSAQT